MNGYNPMLDYQRSQLMAQQAMIQSQLNNINHSQQQFSPYPQNNAQPNFFVRQVGNIEEAKGYPVDPNTMYFFLDTGNGKIYLKQLNMGNGRSDLFTYSVDEATDIKTEDTMTQINSRLANIEKFLGGLKNGESVSNDGDVKQSHGLYAESNAGKIQKPESADVSAGAENGARKKREPA